MRSGVNPRKDQVLARTGRWHRVIVAVYVPEEAGYFSESAEVLAHCLESLLRTTGEETALTVVVNGATDKAMMAVEGAAAQTSRVDVFRLGANVGKVEALFMAFRGTHEPFITMTDCDVLYRPGWLDRTMEVFERLPMVGAVSALPVPHLRRHHTGATYLGAALRGRLRVGPFAKEPDLRQYMADLQSPQLISSALLSRQIAVAVGDGAVLVGCTHMQCTYRREALEHAPSRPCPAPWERTASGCGWIVLLTWLDGGR